MLGSKEALGAAYPSISELDLAETRDDASVVGPGREDQFEFALDLNAGRARRSAMWRPMGWIRDGSRSKHPTGGASSVLWVLEAAVEAGELKAAAAAAARLCGTGPNLPRSPDHSSSFHLRLVSLVILATREGGSTCGSG